MEPRVAGKKSQPNKLPVRSPRGISIERVVAAGTLGVPIFVIFTVILAAPDWNTAKALLMVADPWKLAFVAVVGLAPLFVYLAIPLFAHLTQTSKPANKRTKSTPTSAFGRFMAAGDRRLDRFMIPAAPIMVVLMIAAVGYALGGLRLGAVYGIASAVLLAALISLRAVSDRPRYFRSIDRWGWYAAGAAAFLSVILMDPFPNVLMKFEGKPAELVRLINMHSDGVWYLSEADLTETMELKWSPTLPASLYVCTRAEASPCKGVTEPTTQPSASSPSSTPSPSED